MKCLVIGLDGASFNILLPLVERGLLRNLRGLVERGCRARLRSVMPWQTPSAWTSYSTGVNPGQHGIFGWWRAENGRLVPNNGLYVNLPRYWEVLAATGTTCGVVNVPMTFPPRPLKGFSIAGFDYPDSVAGRPAMLSYPIGLLDELADAGLEYRVFPEWGERIDE